MFGYLAMHSQEIYIPRSTLCVICFYRLLWMFPNLARSCFVRICYTSGLAQSLHLEMTT